MRKWIVAVCLCFLVLLFSYCRQQAGSAVSSDSPYLNHSDTAEYVGMSVCRQCHADKFSTFVHTGMGMSFGLATKEKSAALFGPHVQVYDSILDFYYHPFWQGDSLMIMEFRLDGADTMHKRTEHISYIIGSGQHTNSHLLQVNGYLYQAPITFYTQKQEWDMAPGMSGGFNSRFGRVIESECVTCHNGLPEQVAGSVNKYTGIPLGIDCERCHGPGSIHVARMAGMPKEIIGRADGILKELEQKHIGENLKKKLGTIPAQPMQLNIFGMEDPVWNDIRKELDELDINGLTPIEALLLIQQWKNKLDS